MTYAAMSFLLLLIAAAQDARKRPILEAAQGAAFLAGICAAIWINLP